MTTMTVKQRLCSSAGHILLSASILFGLLFALTYFSTQLAVPVSAQTTAASESGGTNDGTATPDGTPLPDAETTQNLRERIENVVRERSEQVQGAIDRIAAQQRGFVGQVERVTEDSLTVRSPDGLEIFALDETVMLKDNDDETIGVDDLVVGAWATVVGTIRDDSFQALQITIDEENPRPADHDLAIGKITAVDGDTLTLQQRAEDAEITVTFDSDTVFEDIDGTTLTEAALETDTQAVILQFNTETASNAAGIIRILTTQEVLQEAS